MQRPDSHQRLKAAVIVYAVGGGLFVVAAAVTLTWWIAGVGIAYLLLATWDLRQLRHLPPFPTDREGTPPDPVVV